MFSSLNFHNSLGGSLFFLTQDGEAILPKSAQDAILPDDAQTKILFPQVNEDSMEQKLERKQEALAKELSIHPETSSAIVAGILKDGAQIKTEHLIFLVQSTCLYGADMHILVARNADLLRDLYKMQRAELYPRNLRTKCGQVHIDTQGPVSIKRSGRVALLATLREEQRARIKEIWSNQKSQDETKKVVILIDLDLLELPPVSQVMGLAVNMIKNMTNNTTPDVLCAAGAIRTGNGLDGYYDWFATILLPDTFINPVDRRLVPELRPGEDETFIMSKDGKDVELFKWLKQQGGEAKADAHGIPSLSPVPVRSCFGGMALYRASTYLDSMCTYTMVDEDLTRKYGDKNEKLPCEHVTFHECLFGQVNATIAIQPDLRTRWLWNSAPGNPVDLNLASTKFSYLRSS